MQSEQQQPITLFHVCKHDPEQAWIDRLAWRAEAEWQRYQVEADIEREEEIANEIPIVVEPETIPFKVISDWDFYRVSASIPG